MSNLPDFLRNASAEPQPIEGEMLGEPAPLEGELLGQPAPMTTEAVASEGMAEPAFEAGPGFPGIAPGPGGMPGMMPEPMPSPVPKVTPPGSGEPPLYTGWQVGIAAMVGTPLAGFTLLAMNLLRRNQPNDAYVMLLPGAICFVAINFLLPLLPSHAWPELHIVAWLMIWPISLFGLRQFDYDLFGTELIEQEERKEAGPLGEMIGVIAGCIILSLGLQYLCYSQWSMGLFKIFME